jgi:hypothetical protein
MVEVVDMTATERLRELLRERGVEYDDHFDTCTAWLKGEHGYMAFADEAEDGLLSVELYLTPEQAVETTLGREPCRMEWSLADNGWADHTCSNCGYVKNTDIHVYLSWNFCPNCGAPIERRARR